MNERKDERWLDEELRKAINTGKLEFDADAWRREHPEAYRTLMSRVQGPKHDGPGVHWRVRWMAGGLVAAAAVLIGVTIFLTPTPDDRQESAPSVAPGDASPASIVSMISLRSAYRQGGEEALNRQLDMALDRLGPRLNGLSTLHVIRDVDG